MNVGPLICTVTAEYNHGVILENIFLPVYTRTRSTERKMVDSMCNSIFIKDNASSHTAKAPLPGFKATKSMSWEKVFGLPTYPT